eukprot:TRINITY_DN1638_c0_g1_i5.p1 TRINITY_DN1638_c0_g1~~TRINITY_DN1638_c0_g1_i5.p1  ORF type:complete len:167 (+),score=27.99 TRINITY_DN1638_c0_g1_i5:67-501(+)
MQVVNTIVKDSLPSYLANLPIPDTILGWFKLSVGEWARLLPFGIAVGGLSYLSLQGLANSPVIGPMIKDKLACVLGEDKSRVNNQIKMECPKVVDTVDIEDIAEKAVYCRCWKSKKFPFCDGSHAKHNKETGDNVGPLIVKKSQ